MTGGGRDTNPPQSPCPSKGQNCRSLLWAQHHPRWHSLRPSCCTDPGRIWAGVRWHQWYWPRLWSCHWGRRSPSGCTRWIGSTWGLSQSPGFYWRTGSLRKQEVMGALRQLGPQRQSTEGVLSQTPGEAAQLGWERQTSCIISPPSSFSLSHSLPLPLHLLSFSLLPFSTAVFPSFISVLFHWNLI